MKHSLVRQTFALSHEERPCCRLGVAGYAEQADWAGVGLEAGLEPGELVEFAELQAEQHGGLAQAQSQAEQIAPVAYLARV